ncbi:hypothetical protein JOC36_000830 [Weissella uvarum]|nr:hypothetical protein [Weissella uvarum]
MESLDKEAQARGYRNWRELEYYEGENFANELKRDLEYR